MITYKIISLQELSKFGSVNNLNVQVLALLEQQKTTWEVARKNFKALEHVQTKTFDFGHFKIITQFNAERIRSSAAKTDEKSIAERPCFLCPENLPKEQKGLLFQNKYLILINPYPIFSKHLTISKPEHTPQQIDVHFNEMLELSRELDLFTIFYNGPKCGASAPDHFHFQAIGKGNLKVEQEIELLENKYSEVLVEYENSKVIAVENYLRRFVAIISPDQEFIQKKFTQIYEALDKKRGEEPMMNVLCNFNENKWRVIIFPRTNQRSSHFFRSDEKKLLVSPAAVEMGGILVLPREEDFKKITKKEVAEIYDEVTITRKQFKRLTQIFRN